MFLQKANGAYEHVAMMELVGLVHSTRCFSNGVSNIRTSGDGNINHSANNLGLFLDEIVADCGENFNVSHFQLLVHLRRLQWDCLVWQLTKFREML